MKTYIRLIISLFIVFQMIGCSNDLTEKVYSSITEQSYKFTTKDFYPVVTSVYSPMRGYINISHLFPTQEITADIIVMPPNASGWDDNGKYRRLHYHQWSAEQDHFRNIWNTFYQGALLCNNVIAQIESDAVPAPSSAAKEQGLAEVRATRAYYYWMILDNFGDAPMTTVANTQELPEKSSRQEIFNYIVSELQEVVPKLSDEQGGNMYGRFNRWGAKALLANIFLNAEVYTGQPKWSECIAQCDDIINSGKCELSPDFKDPFKAHGVETSKEVLFTIPFDRLYGTGNNLHLFAWHAVMKYKYNTEAMPWGAGTAKGITQFIDTYDPDDQRLPDSWMIGPQYAANGDVLYGLYDQKDEPFTFTKDLPSGNYTKESEGYMMNKFEVEQGETSDLATDFPVFRYAQVLMMKAECLLRLGQSGAGALVTQVRQRAFKNNPEKAMVTDEQLKGNSAYKYGYVENYVITDPGDQSPVQFGRMYDELGWEFTWEMQRRRDCIRYGVFTTKSWLSHKPQGAFHTVFPIPQTALTANPKLSQNPAYSGN